jgi:isochorismate synthase
MESGELRQRDSGMTPAWQQRSEFASRSLAGPELCVAWAEALVPSLELPGPPAFVLRSGALELAASGEALRLSGEGALRLAARARVTFRRPLPVALPGPFVAVLPFSDAAGLGASWQGFRAPAAFAPELMVFRDGARWFAASLAPAAAGPQRAEALLEAALARMASRALLPPAPALAATRREDPHAAPRWMALVERALLSIARGELQKVVLARALDVGLSAPPSPQQLCAALARRFPICRTFWLQGEGAAFAGASPETLAVVEQGRVRCDALAGTAAPGRPLLGLDKELREHRAVVDDLHASLAPLADSIDAAQVPKVLSLANVDHLHTEVSARLRPGADIADVAEALHPTSAVAGTPRPAALRFIAAHEGLDRGLYAGLVGLVGPGRSELHVALRSALLRGASARLFVGAGIVAGSDPLAEWEETQLKAQALLGALGAGR